MVAIKNTAPKSRCSTLFYITTGFFAGSLLIFFVKSKESLVSPVTTQSLVPKCPFPQVRGSRTNENSSLEASSVDYSLHVDFDNMVQTCLDTEGPLPVVLMSLGRSGTDSTWQILKTLTNTEMKAIEIVGSNEPETRDFFHSLEGMKTEADNWALDDTYDWRKKGGGMQSAHGFYYHIKDFCADGNCMDGKWMFKWFCDEQSRHKEIGGLVGFKWKVYMSALRTEPAFNALKMMATLGPTKTPVYVIRSRRNPLDVYLSELKHSQKQNLPDHCKVDDEACMKMHTSIRLVAPVEEMYEWLQKTYEEENEVDATLTQLGVRTVFVGYDELYYPKTELEGVKEWNKILKFLGKRHDWTWNDIADAAGLKPTTKSRSHKILIDNFDDVYNRLKGTKLEQFIRM